MNDPGPLTLEAVRSAVAGHASAFRCVTEYQPAGGPGDKVFPPTYEGGKYAVETRVVAGQPVPCVILNSVQAEANRMELALRDEWEAGRLPLPVLRVEFNVELKGRTKVMTVTSLDAAHRIADAIFRDSRIKEDEHEVMFRKSKSGAILDAADLRNATGLFGLCPTALLFGLWDSAGPRGGLGAKFQRAIVSEIVGWGAQPGIATGGKVDHLTILKSAGEIYQRAQVVDDAPDWTLDKKTAKKKDGEPRKVGKKSEGKPSDVNLGGVTPDFAYARDSKGRILRDEVPDQEGRTRERIKGGFTIEKAVQTTVVSLPALRRLRFPVDSKSAATEVDVAARTVLATLGLCATALAREAGADLRSRCHLVPTGSFTWMLLDEPGRKPEDYPQYGLPADSAVALFKEAVAVAKQKGLPWQESMVKLQPSPDLALLVQRSHELAAEGAEDEGDAG
jgi:CRISPR-associated protein Csb1